MEIGLNTENKAKVIAAIKANEIKTSGEIYCVIARKSDDYRWILMIWAVVLSLIIPLLMALFNFNLFEFLFSPILGWQAASIFENSSFIIYGDLILQALIFVIAAFLSRNNEIVLALTPQSIKRQDVHKFARDQFLAHGIHQTNEKTGVLIYVSLAEHIVEIVADSGIHSKVSQNFWGDAIAKILIKTKQGDLADGLVDGINDIGAILAEHFPPSKNDENELSDSVVFI